MAFFDRQSPRDARARKWELDRPFPVGSGFERSTDILCFRPNARMHRIVVPPGESLSALPSESLSPKPPIRVFVRFWLEAGDEPLADWQVAETNRVLMASAGFDSGIRLELRESRVLPQSPIQSVRDLGCRKEMALYSAERDTVDIHLHRINWPCRACPIERRIFLSVPRLTRFGLAHEFMHLLGMPECAHVDENPYLVRGNVMERSPLGGAGRLTLGQLCVMNLSRDSLAAQLRRREEPGFELLHCLDDRGEPVDSPSLGLETTGDEAP